MPWLSMGFWYFTRQIGFYMKPVSKTHGGLFPVAGVWSYGG